MKALTFISCKRQLGLLNSNRANEVLRIPPLNQGCLKVRHFFLAYPLSRGEDSYKATELSNGHAQLSHSTEPAQRKTCRVWSVFNSITDDVDVGRMNAKQEYEEATPVNDSRAGEELEDSRNHANGKSESESSSDSTGDTSSTDHSSAMIEGNSSDQIPKSEIHSKDNPIADIHSKDTPSRNSSLQMNGKTLFSRHVPGNIKKTKSKTSFVCKECGHTDGQWWGFCPMCRNANTLTRFSEHVGGNVGKVSTTEISEKVVRSWLPNKTDERPLKLADVNRGINLQQWRIPLTGDFGREVDRVIGGGLVPGCLVLVGGDPGVGKSTMLLQIGSIIASSKHNGGPASVVYVSGEESVKQIGDRAARMMIETQNLYLYSNTDIEDIIEKILPISPCALIIDSIQTVYLENVVGSAGSLNQVRECTSALLRFAKTTNVSVILIGHVTKSGEIAGPRTLEHIVDVVLYMEGEKSSSHRLLRPVKNRYGSLDELGVFEMSPIGLKPVLNPAEMFLPDQVSDSEVLAGQAVTVIMDGCRSFLIEIQALCVSGSSVSRHVNGIQPGRTDMILSVLKKQAGLMIQQHTVFLNVIGGVTLTETSGDLAIAAAICSSFLESPIPNTMAFIGEIGLGGELRSVPRMDKRVSTLAQMGFQKCIFPKQSLQSLTDIRIEGIEVIGCSNLKEVINNVFK